MKSNRLQMTVKTPRDIERFADTIRALTFAGMSLEIQQSGDEAYIDIEPRIEPAKQPTIVRIESQSDPGFFYPVEVTNGVAECPCIGFSYREECRHSRLAERKVRLAASGILS